VLSSDNRPLLCGGMTQSQKTGFKVVMYAMPFAFHTNIGVG
jgi:hypothetical protein